MEHFLFSDHAVGIMSYFEKYDKEAIRKAIKEHLFANPNAIIEHCKNYSKSDYKKFLGHEIINLYEMNPKNNLPSLIVTRGNKTYYKTI